MPIQSRPIPREGFTADTLGRLISTTILNPVLILPLLLLLRYTSKGTAFALLHETLVRRLRYAFYVGAFRWVSSWLSDQAANNWTSDTYHWRDQSVGALGKEIVLVTGGSDGIGKQVVLLLAEHARTVIVLDVQPLNFDAPANVHHYHCDLSDPTAINSTTKTLTQDHGAPTILINNAGVALGTSILTGTPATLRLTFDVNTLAHYHLTRALLPAMLAAKHGMIVTVASLAAYIPAPMMVEYAASKAASLAFHEGLASELRTLHRAPTLRTVLLTQGYTRTALFDGFHAGNSFLMPVFPPESVAEGLVRQILTGRSG